MEEISDAKRRVKTNESTILVTDRHGDVDVNDIGRLLLQLCCNNALCIINTFFQHRDVHWCRDSLGNGHSLISAYFQLTCCSGVQTRERLGVANNGKKSNALLEPRGERCSSRKESSLQGMASEKKPSLLCISGTVRRESPQHSQWKTVKKSKIQSWENFGHKLDFNYWQANKMFWQTTRRLCGKRSDTAKSIKKTKCCLTQQWEGPIWQTENIKYLLNLVTITPLETHEVHLREENAITATEVLLAVKA